VYPKLKVRYKEKYKGWFVKSSELPITRHINQDLDVVAAEIMEAGKGTDDKGRELEYQVLKIYLKENQVLSNAG
jgi:hypothetical protein